MSHEANNLVRQQDNSVEKYQRASFRFIKPSQKNYKKIQICVLNTKILESDFIFSPNDLIYKIGESGKNTNFKSTNGSNSEQAQKGQIKDKNTDQMQQQGKCNMIKNGLTNEKVQDKQKKQASDSNSQYCPSSKSSPKKQSKYREVQTKNIIRNYGRALISFIYKNRQLTQRILSKRNQKWGQFYRRLAKQKNRLLSIKQLRSIWKESQNPFAKQFRILSYIFFSKYFLHYVFHSKMMDIKLNMKFRAKILEGIKDPDTFTLIKQY